MNKVIPFLSILHFEDLFSWLILLAILGVMVLALILYWKYARSPTRVETVEFYPPADLNPAQVGYLYRGHIDNQDLMLLIIYLADQGFLKIETRENEKYTLHKIKEYNGDDEILIQFWRGLFGWGRDHIDSDHLQKELTDTLSTLTYYLQKTCRPKYFDPKMESVTWWLLGLAVAVIYLLMTRTIAAATKDSDLWLTPVVAVFVFTPFLVGGMLVWWIGRNKRLSTMLGVFLPILVMTDMFLFGNLSGIHQTVWWLEITYLVLVRLIVPENGFTMDIATIMSLYPYFFLVGEIYSLKNDFILTLNCLGWLMLATVVIAAWYIFRRRTLLGEKYLTQIISFRRFLLTAQKNQLEKLLDEQPAYYYHTLSYAWTLGVSKAWINKFATDQVDQAIWYDNPNALNSSLDVLVKSLRRSGRALSRNAVKQFFARYVKFLY